MPHRFAVLSVALFLLFATPSLADQWDPKFGSAIPTTPSLNYVRNFFVEGNDIYAISNTRVAKWDGNTWSDLGAISTSSTLPSMCRYKNWLAIAPAWVNGQSGDVALWDGTAWSELDLSLVSTTKVYSDANYLYVGGRDSQGSYGAIRRWDGTTEIEIPSIMKTIHAFLEWNGNLFVGGVVNFPGSPPYEARGVVYWDGSQWQLTGDINPFGTPANLLVYENELYAGGNGQNGNGSVKKWTGASWVEPAPNLYSCGDTDILFHDGRLYRTCVSVVLQGVAMFKDGVWLGMDNGVVSGCSARLAEYQGHVLVGVGVTSAGGMATPGLALWDGDNWRSRGLDGGVLALASNGSDVFVTGVFENAFNTPAHRIARWDGSNWSSLGSGIDGSAHAAVMVGNDLYVGGEFTDAGGTGAVNLAKWNGAAWSSVGSSLGGPVYSLATDGTDLYVGGNFQSYQGESLQGIARWDGASFHALGTGINNGSVRTILADGGVVYAAGDFTTAGGSPTGNTAVWNGSWNTVGNGINGGMVRALEIFNGALYAAGEFYSYPLQRMARFDGSQWVALFPGLNGPAWALASMSNKLYVTGSFTTAGGNAANRIAAWNGTSFSTLGSGLDQLGRALAPGPQGMWVGGDFRMTGGVGAGGIGHYVLTPTAVTPSIATKTSLEAVFPNPFNPNTSIRYRVGANTRVTLAIYDVNGRLVRHLFDDDVNGSAEQRVLTWDGSDNHGHPVASGVYFVRMHTPALSESRKMVLLK